MLNVRGCFLAILFGALAILFACEATLPTASIDWRKSGGLVVNNVTTETFTTLWADGRVLDTMVSPGQHFYRVTIYDRWGDGRRERSQSVEVLAEAPTLGISSGRSVTITTDGDANEVEFDEWDFPNRPR